MISFLSFYDSAGVKLEKVDLIFQYAIRFRPGHRKQKTHLHFTYSNKVILNKTEPSFQSEFS